MKQKTYCWMCEFCDHEKMMCNCKDSEQYNQAVREDLSCLHGADNDDALMAIDEDERDTW